MTINTNCICRFACVFLIAAIYIVFAGNLLVNNGFYIDDRLYLYTVNFLVCEPDRWQDAYKTLLAFLGSSGYSGEDISVFQFRQAYSDNYLIHAAASCMARVLLPQHLLDVDYGTWIYVVVQTGVGLSHLLCLIVVIWAVATSRGRAIHYITLLGFGVLASLAIDLPSRNWRLTNAPSVVEFLFQTVIFTISPGFEFDVFGLTPRSDATLLLVAITVFRWQGRIGAGYWTIVLASLVHGTYGALMLGAFLVLDVLLQPSALRNWRCVIPIVLVFLTTLARVQSFEAFDGTFIQLGALVAAAAAIGAAATPQGDRLLGNIPLVRWFRSRSSLNSETLILVIGMGMAVTIAFIVAAFSTGLTEKYVAHELSGRPIALLRVPVLLGVCAIIMNTKINGSTRFWPAVAFAVAILALVTGFNKPNHTRKSWLTAEEMEPGLQKAISGTGSRLSRLQLYYVFSCGVDGNCQYLNELNKKISGR